MKKTNGLIIMLLGMVVLIFTIVSCTENTRARGWGGTMTINLDPHQKLINVTWKETDMWILTRPMHVGEQSETYKFTEKSTFGVMEGQITIVESGGSKPTSYLVNPTTPDMDIQPKPIIKEIPVAEVYLGK